MKQKNHNKLYMDGKYFSIKHTYVCYEIIKFGLDIFRNVQKGLLAQWKKRPMAIIALFHSCKIVSSYSQSTLD